MYVLWKLFFGFFHSFLDNASLTYELVQKHISILAQNFTHDKSSTCLCHKSCQNKAWCCYAPGVKMGRKSKLTPQQVEHIKTTNILWVSIGNNRYAFSYNHDEKQIEMRKDSIQGSILHTFTNATSLSSVRTIFQSLWVHVAKLTQPRVGKSVLWKLITYLRWFMVFLYRIKAFWIV